MSENNKYLLEMRGITKLFPGVVACNDVTLQVKKGEIHALIGENGAGKSTLIKILSGSQKCDAGEIIFDGNTYREYLPSKAIEMGISVIYQEFNLFPSLTVYENIFFGKEIRSGIFIKPKEMIEKTKKIFGELKMQVDPCARVADLSVAQQQMTEIAKAVANEAKLIVMDEPSATLTNKELEHLFELMKRLKERGTAIVYISHRMEEIFEICDCVTVMRDGEYITKRNVEDTNRAQLITDMVGREINIDYPYESCKNDEIVLEVKNMYSSKVKNINFNLRKGEVLGLTGLVGAGRTELARALFGADKAAGIIKRNGKKVSIRSPRDAIRAGIVLLPEDRKAQGLLLNQNLQFNMSFSVLDKIAKAGLVIDKKADAGISEEYIRSLRVKTPSKEQLAKNLSGGNQQKVVIGKWLATDSDVIIFDEPTRGIDVGAKHEIYTIINNLKRQGKSIIMISSELPEVIGMSDRALVMYDGKIVGELNKEEMSQERILKVAAGEEERVNEAK
ncbi:MAG: sugar ABC transporter ATP-binding protein [Christensenella sp.]|nr:sugar ABC transporter ATP-binding protein [Christensenella sp.]